MVALLLLQLAILILISNYYVLDMNPPASYSLCVESLLSSLVGLVI